MRTAPPLSLPNHAQPAASPRPIGRWRWWILVGGVLGLLALAGLIGLAGRWAKAKLTNQYPPPGQLIDVGGYRLHLDCRGQGSPTVLLEAGLNDFSVHWARVQPAVAQFTQVCTYDRAGLGWSDPSPHPRTPATMANELQTLLTRAGVTAPYVLVGHSFGGIQVRHFVRQAPGAVLGLVLVDSAHEAQGARTPHLRTALAQLTGQFRVLALLNRWGLIALAPAQIPNRGLPADALAQYRARLAVSGYFEAAIAESRAFATSLDDRTTHQPVALSDLPLIVISRGQPAPVPGLSASEQGQYEASWRRLQAELAASSANSQQWIASQSGHDSHLQQPELVIAAIQQLVEDEQVEQGAAE
jgi:pimeloyl-ACP methyl ester carboxylesterase